VAELGAGLRVRWLDVGLLRPRVASARENVDRARVEDRVIRLIAVDGTGRAGFVRRANRQRSAIRAEGNPVAVMALILAAAAEVIGGLGIRCLQIRGLPYLQRRDRWPLRARKSRLLHHGQRDTENE